MDTRSERRAVAEDTLSLLEDDAETWDAFRATTVWDPRMVGHVPAVAGKESVFEVWPGLTTIEACRQLAVDHPGNVCALNYASAKNPGGGVLNGATAQEESNCQVSGLYHCLNGGAAETMYERNRANPRRGLYHDLAIYSPKVPVIKSPDGQFVDRYHVNFVTCPAVNLGVAVDRGVPRAEAVAAMGHRIDLALGVMARHDQKVLVLGAFGCGVFKNNPKDVAVAFKNLLATKYEGCFDHVVFAIPSQDVAATFIATLE